MKYDLRWPSFVLGSVLVLTQLATAAGQTGGPDPCPNDVRDSSEFLGRVIRHTQPADHAKEADELLRKMTLREKIGQMTQLDIQMVTDGKDQDIRINPAKLDKAVVQYGVGALLNVYDEALPPERWQNLIGQIQAAAARTRLKIPVLYGLDSIHGANYVQRATLFPQPLGMAATWNPDLVLRASQISADETRAVGVPWVFAPILDIGRQPLWPRSWETYGEDPHLASVMGVAVVRGFEGDNLASEHQVASSLKHYVGYSGPTSGRDRTPALIPEVTLREYYLPTFRAAVQAGACTIMVNSSEVNGIPGHVNHYLLTEVLRDELKFDGVVDSDWQDIKRLVTSHHVAATEKEATRMAVMAGIDMSMVPRDYSFSDLLTELVQEGSVPVSRIDEAVRRILRLKFQLGLFLASTPKPEWIGRIGTPESRRVSLQAARESIVLVKNERATLPLQQGWHILLTGPTADSLISLNNGWSFTWQGDKVSPTWKDFPTLRRALESRAGAQNVTYVPGADFDRELNISAARAAAAKADVIVVALGEASYAETPGNIADLTLMEAQQRLAEAMIEMGKPVVLVLIEGRPRIISRIADRVPAIVVAFNPSNEGAQAISEVLFGDVNPSGKLPLTYPRHPNALLTYDHKVSEDDEQSIGSDAFRPQFEFGSGLSYTAFQYSNLSVSPTVADSNTEVNVSVRVENTGKRAGKEVVQLYLSDLVAPMTPPRKKLMRFAKILLEPAAHQVLSFKLTSEDASFIGPDKRPVRGSGEYEITISNLRARFVWRNR
jgi:beta-glucosidase